MYCMKCGAQLLDNAKFCHRCGSATAQLSVPEEPTPQPEVSAPVAPVEQPAVAEPVAVPKKRRTGLIIGICAGAIALLAALTLLAGYFFFDWFQPESDDDKKDSSSQREEDDDDDDNNGDGDEDEEDDPPAKIKLTIKEANLVYELTDADVDAYYELLSSTEELALHSTDEDAVMDAVDALDDSFSYLETQHSIASVLHYCDLEDTDASDLYLACTEILTEANDEYIKMCRRVYESDCPAKDAFFEDWTELDLTLLMAYTEEVMTLTQRNSEIEVEYQKLQDDPALYEAMVPLYIEMVQNNNRIAQIYGYDNYYAYAYEVDYMRDYDPAQIEDMRTYVSQYFPDALDDATEQLMENLDNLNDSGYSKLSDLLFASYEDGTKKYITGYLKTLPKQTRNDMLDMFNGNILMMNDAINAMEGAFTSAIGPDRQICFFGPGYDNATTLIHEVGHYYGGCHQYLNDLPLDLAETHSQGNEWLFLQYLESQLNADLHETLVNFRFVEDLSMIMICVIVDEFEQQVYTHPNISSLTSSDLDQIMEDVCRNYGGIEYLTSNVADIQYYWRMVVVEQPVYYISYAVSAVASIDLYTVAKEDYDEAVKIYQKLIENVDLEEGFLGNITAAGLTGPFNKEFYQEVSNLLED